MTDGTGNWISYAGEVYNYLELREELGREKFRTQSDTEVILRAYRNWGPDCALRFRGMYSFALWDEERQELFCARDLFGIKPFYYTVVDDCLYFASEVKTLLPFLPSVQTDTEGLKDYLAFQFCLAGKTLFKGVQELQPAHSLRLARGRLDVRRYWEIYYHLDWDHTEKYFEEEMLRRLEESARLHLRSDVPIGTFVSGGLDSSLVAALGSRRAGRDFVGFHGRFTEGPEYDESPYARALTQHCGFPLEVLDITCDDFVRNIRKVIYQLDFPVAGPGSFPQYMVSQLAGRRRKVVLGGEGGDEVFGGYVRYLVAYFEQCIKGAIEGTSGSGRYVVTYESIIPNLVTLKGYKPMLQEFWREGLFDDMDRRYFHLINRASMLKDEINWSLLGDYSPYETFRGIFQGSNVQEPYFDRMTHFDFKTLLPALLQVEDRVGMAHGLESRVPILDRAVVELSAAVPASVKFKNGTLKHMERSIGRRFLPDAILDRKDKMGFPTPLTEWIKGPARSFVVEVFSCEQARRRELIDNRKVLAGLESEPRYGRKIWGLLCLELWQQEFHDRAAEFRRLLKEPLPAQAPAVPPSA
jgi:asparagine synthase (glutamine-hydrolysing)